MKNIITEYFELFNFRREGFLGIILGLGITLIVAFLLTVVIFITITIIDKAFVSEYDAKGVIVEKSFIPEHIEKQQQYNPAFEIIEDVDVEIPDEWVVIIAVDTSFGRYSVEQKYFDKVNIRDTINVKYSIGRISNEFTITEIK